MLQRKARKDKFLAYISIILFAGFSFLIKNKFDYYLILILPIFYLVLASFISDFMKRAGGNKEKKRKLAFITSSFVWAGIISIIILNFPSNYKNHYLDYEITQDQINSSIRDGDVVMATQTYWLGLIKHNYYSWEQITYYNLLYPDSSIEDALSYFRPDIFIIDSQMSFFITDTPEALPYSGVVSLPETDLKFFLEKHAMLVNEFKNPSYGTVQVYRILWE